MGHSQSYNLQNHDINEKAPVRGVRRVSKEPPENTQFSAESNSEPHDVREIQLRERIRQEQLRDRELELESMRIRRNESREPIIDAYRQSQPPIYKEFNHYDSLKQHSPVDPVTYFNLRPYTEVNDGRQLPIPTSPTDFYDQVPVEPTIRYDQVPVEPTLRTTRREAPVKQTINSVDYPRRTSLYSGRLSPLQRQEEVGQHSMPSYSPPTSPRYDGIPPGTTYSKTTSVTTYTITRSGSVPNFENNVAPDNPKTSGLQKHEEIPVRYSKGTEVSYEKISKNPYATYSRASTKDPRHSKYYEAPRSGNHYRASEAPGVVPSSDSVQGSYSRTSRIPTYNEVPIQKYARPSTPVYVPPANRVLIQTSPPIPKPQIHLTPLHRDVSKTSLDNYVSRSPIARTQSYPISIDTRSVTSTPDFIVIPFSSTTNQRSTAIPSPSEYTAHRRVATRQTKYPSSLTTPVPSDSSQYRIVSMPPKASPNPEAPIYRHVVPKANRGVHLLFLQRDVPHVPLDQCIHRRPISMDKITMSVTYRPRPYSRKDTQPRYLKAAKNYRQREAPNDYQTPLQVEPSQVPLNQRVLTPIYDYPPSEDESGITVITLSSEHSTPSPKSSSERSALMHSTPYQKNVSQISLYKRPIESRPPSENSKLSSPRTRTPKEYLKPVEREAPRTPSEKYVKVEPKISRTVVYPPRRNPTPPLKIYLTRYQEDIPEKPLENYVSTRMPKYSTPPDRSYRICESPRSSPVLPLTKIYVTPLQPEVPRTPLSRYVSKSAPKSYTPPVDKKSYRPPSGMSSKQHKTPLHEEVPGTPLQHYISRRDPIYSTPPPEDERIVTRTVVAPISSTPTSPSFTMPPQRQRNATTPLSLEVSQTPLRSPVSKVIYSTPPLENNLADTRSVTPSSAASTPLQARTHVTRRCSDAPSAPLSNIASRTLTPSTAPLTDYYSLPLEKAPKSSLDHYPNTFPRIAHKSTQTTFDPNAAFPPKVYRTRIEKEIPKLPYDPKSGYNRKSTIISIYSTPIVDTPTQVSEIHAQKRMVVGIDEPKDNVTYVTVATSPIACPDEPLYRHADVKKHPVYVSPSQTNYEVGPRRDSQTHYSRRQPDKAANISEPSQRCNVENCTHVEITEMESPILEGRTSKDTNKYKESRITIPVQGNDLDNVVELVHDNEDSGTSKSNRCFEEKLFYDPYMPTLSLNRRPIASFYDKIH